MGRRSTRRRLILTVAGATASGVLLSTSPSTASPGVLATTASSTDTTVLRQWNLIAQGVAVTLRPTAHGQGRGMAMVQGAVYDAVNAIDRGHEAYLLDVEDLAVPAWASSDAAAATAAHGVLVHLAPSSAGTLDTELQNTLAGIVDGPAESEGVRAGQAAASAMIAARAGDGSTASFTFDIRSGAGRWRPLTPTALDPDANVANLRPFTLTSPGQFRTAGPNALTSDTYVKEFNEVKALGSLTSTRRTADQTMAAIFWQVSPVPLWHGLARTLAVERGLSVADSSRLFAMISLSAADAGIACWNDKYRWYFWRPLAAIREADTDDNPATVADPTWRALFDPSTPTTPALATPPFPEHPSGHGCVSGATLTTMASFFGTDKVAFSVSSGRFPGQLRHFERFSHATKEIIDARVWGGIHFRSADVQGAVLGRKVTSWMTSNYFAPTS